MPGSARRYPLLNSAENRLPLIVQHFDTHHITWTQKRRKRLLAGQEDRIDRKNKKIKIANTDAS